MGDAEIVEKIGVAEVSGGLADTRTGRPLRPLRPHAVGLLGKNLVRRVATRSQPRPARHVKPHPHMAYKG